MRLEDTSAFQALNGQDPTFLQQAKRDITITNKDSITRWIDQLIGTLEDFKGQLQLEDEDQLREQIGEFFTEAQDLRAQAESVKARSSEMMPEEDQANTGGMMRSMFFGSFGKKKDDKKKRR